MMSKDNIKAVLFDMDGVLYDSMKNHAWAWHNAMEACGLPMSEAEAYECEGMRGMETIQLMAQRHLRKRYTEEEVERMYALKSDYFKRLPEARIMPGILDLMSQIKAEDREIVVVTGSGQHSLLEKLTTDFAGFITKDHIVTAFDVSRGKPAPDPYLMGLEKAGGIAPSKAVVVENAPLGVRAAVAAGITTLAVNTGPLPAASLLIEGAARVFQSMQELAEKWRDL